jgi:hypothetical protein
VDWHLATLFLPTGTTQEQCVKPPCKNLHGGHLPLSSPMERYICLCWLSPVYSDPGSTQILIQLCSVKSKTISQLATTRTMPTRQVPSQFSPYVLSKHLRPWSVHMPHTVFQPGQMRELHESLAKIKIVHMKHSLHLSF